MKEMGSIENSNLKDLCVIDFNNICQYYVKYTKMVSSAYPKIMIIFSSYYIYF